MKGDYVKVLLPGELPWVEVLEQKGRTFLGRIDNKLFAEYSDEERAAVFGYGAEDMEPLPRLHNYKQNDELWFVRNSDNTSWIPFSESLETDGPKN